MSTDQPYKPDQLLSTGQCRDVFCDEMDYGRTLYYEEHYPHLYFKSYSSSGSSNIRMPYAIIKGIINYIKGISCETDPPLEILADFADLDALERKNVEKVES